MAVRLPYRPVNDDQLDKLEHWLPILAPRLPLPIPTVLARGEPSDEYPAAWSIVRWLPGEEAALDRLANPEHAARSLAEFVTALRATDATGAPTPGEHNFWRGVPLAARDGTTRRCIRVSAGLIDAEALTRAWDQALSAPAWARGRGLALSVSIVALPYYLDTIPVRAERALGVIREVLADLALDGS